jgi:hypothetical protein
MVDPGFLEALVQSPESTLADYELDDGERAAVMRAVKQLAATPAARRGGAFQSALIRRLAT